VRSRDSEGHLRARPGERIGRHYVVETEAGTGTFGRVFYCHDARHGTRVAVKVVRCVDRYSESARIEADLLRDIAKRDPGGTSLNVRMLDDFEFRGHVCMVFEPLGCSLYDFVKDHDYRPMPVTDIRIIGRQLLHAVAFLHGMRLAHTDLKLENVLLVRSDPNPRVPVGYCSPRYKDVRVIDFGGATYEDEHHSSIVNTRQYRAPEVILGLGWSYPSDIWSVACILMELFGGDLLFNTHANREHLALMQRIVGPIPKWMAFKSNSSSRRYFDDDGRLIFPHPRKTSSSSRVHVESAKPLEHQLVGHPQLLDLIVRMLEYDPSRRLTAQQALDHPFFTKGP